MKRKFEPCCVIENDKVMMYLDPPNWRNATRIDVTMAFNLGSAIGQRNFSGIDVENIKINP